MIGREEGLLGTSKGEVVALLWRPEALSVLVDFFCFLDLFAVGGVSTLSAFVLGLVRSCNLKKKAKQSQ